MFEHEIRWPVLLPVSLLLGMGVLFFETAGLFPNFPARPDWFWCLAFATALRAPPVSSLFAFAWCGLARDLLLGPKMGAASIAFILVGWLFLHIKSLTAERGLLNQALVAGISGCTVALLRHCLDAGALAATLWDKILVFSVADGLLTAVLYIPAALLLLLPSFRTWRERGGYY